MATATRPRSDSPPSVTALPERPASRLRFTAADSYRMVEAGILRRDARVELIDGDLVATCPIGPWHASVVDLLGGELTPRVVGRAIVRTQSPIRLDDHSEPQPDLMLLRSHDHRYKTTHPGPADVLLLIEVMDSSASYDRGTKLGLYARFGVAEVWLIDLNEHLIEVHRTPEGETYTERLIRGKGHRVAPAALPDVELDVDAIFA